MYSREDKIFVKIIKNGYIPFIGMCGPIPNPIKIPTGTCLQMITAGIDVFEVNPDTKETVKLTVTNVFDDDKFGKKSNPIELPKQPTINPTDKVMFTGVSQIPEEVKNVDAKSSVDEKSDDTKTDVPSVDKVSDDAEKDSDSEEKTENNTENNVNTQQTQQSNDTKNKNKNKNRK